MDFKLSVTWTAVLIALAVWELAWKGVALWKSARSNHPGWFIALLLINSAGILPIYYLLAYRYTGKEKGGFSHEETTIPIKG